MKVVSFHNGNIPREVIEAQASVFRFFKQPLEQILTTLQHFEAIDEYIESNPNERRYTFFDIDAIPLTGRSLSDMQSLSILHDSIVGGIQNANHIKDGIDYASPACITFSRAVFDEIGKPSFAPTSRADCGGEISFRALENGIELDLLPVMEVEKPLWRLSSGGYFGHGTTYQYGIYHAFEARLSESSRSRFINKCRSITRGA